MAINKITFCVYCKRRVKNRGICDKCYDREKLGYKRYKYPAKHAISDKVRKDVMAEPYCHICKDNVLHPGEYWTVEHIVPVSSGGSNHRSNLCKAHSSCNFSKAATEDKRRANGKQKDTVKSKYTIKIR